MDNIDYSGFISVLADVQIYDIGIGLTVPHAQFKIMDECLYVLAWWTASSIVFSAPFSCLLIMTPFITGTYKSLHQWIIHSGESHTLLLWYSNPIDYKVSSLLVYINIYLRAVFMKTSNRKENVSCNFKTCNIISCLWYRGDV